jgi:hypothetical protein
MKAETEIPKKDVSAGRFREPEKTRSAKDVTVLMPLGAKGACPSAPVV